MAAGPSAHNKPVGIRRIATNRITCSLTHMQNTPRLGGGGLTDENLLLLVQLAGYHQLSDPPNT